MSLRQENWALPPGPRAVGVARSHVAEACRHLPRETVDVALLLTSEIVTNAVQCSAGDVRMSLEANGDLLVEVHDQAPAIPTRQPAPPLAERGRGLMIVEAFADAWGTRSHGLGKSVWFSLHCGAAVAEG